MLGYITDSSAPGGLVRRELPEPEPTVHQAVIEVAAYGVNRGELNLLPRRADGRGPREAGHRVALAGGAAASAVLRRRQGDRRRTGARGFLLRGGLRDG
jgi:NADPH:quinone reductase-like Zn-dependent oxidoreductase